MERVERTFLGTDLVGSTRLWNRHPDAMAQLVRELDSLVEACVCNHGGTVFKATGDGHFAAFLTSEPAVHAALSIRDQVARLNIAGESVQLRLVLHGGEVDKIDGDFFGPALNLLGRLLKATHGGQVVATEWVPEWWFDFDHIVLGGFMVSGFDEPVFLTELNPTGPMKLPKLTNAQDLYRTVPVERTSLVGRKRELDSIRRSLSEHPVTTLVGPGGVGKTRLAVHIAHSSLAHFAKGIWMLSLVQMKSGDDLVGELERVTQCRLRDDESGFESLATRLGDGAALLILDNAEHVRDEACALVRKLERAVPSLKILVTSREALAIPSERVVPVEPFEPQAEERVHLFVERVRDFRPDWNPTPDEVQSIELVCERLDGVPFAIELAAARLRSTSLADLVEALNEGLNSVGSGFREGRERREDLADVVRWSIDMLSAEERSCLLKLAIAEPGFDIRAVRAIAAFKRSPAGELVDSLVSKCLLVFDGRRHTYSMLQITRNVAVALLEESGEAESARNAHFYEYMGRVLPRLDDLRGEKQADTLHHWDLERPNILAAFEYGIQKTNLCGIALEAAAVFWRYWSLRGHLVEGVHRLERILSLADEDGYEQAKSRALRGLAWLGYLRGDVGRAEKAVRAALPLAEQGGDASDQAACHSLLGSILSWRGDFDAASDQYLLAQSGFQRVEDHPNLARTYLHLGDAALGAGKSQQARQYIVAAQESFAKLGDELAEAWALYSLGRCDEADGQLSAAESCYRESKRIRELRGDRRGVAYAQQALCAISEDSLRSAIDLGLEAMGTFSEIGDEGGLVAASLALARRLEVVANDLARGFASVATRKAADIGLAFTLQDAKILERFVSNQPTPKLDWLVSQVEELIANRT